MDYCKRIRKLSATLSSMTWGNVCAGFSRALLASSSRVDSYRTTRLPSSSENKITRGSFRWAYGPCIASSPINVHWRSRNVHLWLLHSSESLPLLSLHNSSNLDVILPHPGDIAWVTWFNPVWGTCVFELRPKNLLDLRQAIREEYRKLLKN